MRWSLPLRQKHQIMILSKMLCWPTTKMTGLRKRCCLTKDEKMYVYMFFYFSAATAQIKAQKHNKS